MTKEKETKKRVLATIAETKENKGQEPSEEEKKALEEVLEQEYTPDMVPEVRARRVGGGTKVGPPKVIKTARVGQSLFEKGRPMLVEYMEIMDAFSKNNINLDGISDVALTFSVLVASAEELGTDFHPVKEFYAILQKHVDKSIYPIDPNGKAYPFSDYEAAVPGFTVGGKKFSSIQHLTRWFYNFYLGKTAGRSRQAGVYILDIRFSDGAKRRYQDFALSAHFMNFLLEEGNLEKVEAIQKRMAPVVEEEEVEVTETSNKEV